MMTRRRVVYPLFFLLLAIFILPSIQKAHAPTNVTFVQTTAVNDCSSASSCATASFTDHTGNIIVVFVDGVGVFNSFSYSDSQTNTFTQKIASVTGNSGGRSTYIATATIVSGGSDTITVSTGGGLRGYAVWAEEYSGVSSFGVTATEQNDAINSGNSYTSTITFSGTQNSGSMVVETDAITTASGVSVTITYNNAQTQRQLLNNGANVCFTANLCQADEYVVVGTTFSLSNTMNWGGAACSAGNCFESHVGLELIGSTPSSPTTQVSQCYGNCGTPPIKLVNTNSTHTTNFNGSLTLFYEAQSNLNGVLNNVTLNMAKSYVNGMQVSLGLYTAVCNVGIAPFTASCPGQQQILQTFTNPVKGRLSITQSGLQVQNQMWLGIAVSCIINGCDLNDTNTSVPLYNQNPAMPPILSSASLLGPSNMGLWAWVTGAVGGVPPVIPPVSCGADFICIMLNSVVTLTPTNLIAGAIFFAFIYSIFSTIGIIFISGYLAKSFGQSVTLPPGMFLMIWFGWFMFWPAIVGAIWFTVLVMIILILTFASFSGALLKGGVVTGGQTA